MDKPHDETTVRDRGYLAHGERLGATYFVTIRLADALPHSVVERLTNEREEMQLQLTRGQRALTIAERAQLETVIARKIEAHLDTGAGACYLARPDIAALVADSLRSFDGIRYELLSWCIMPNHVHVVVEPAIDQTLARLAHSWKSFTAHAANRLLRREGAFWQREYYDHLVRDERSFARIVRYVVGNPVKARLENWPWVYVRPEWETNKERA